MSSLTIGLGVTCCIAGAAAHSRDPALRAEGLFGPVALALPLAGTVPTRS